MDSSQYEDEIKDLAARIRGLQDEIDQINSAHDKRPDVMGRKMEAVIVVPFDYTSKLRQLSMIDGDDSYAIDMFVASLTGVILANRLFLIEKIKNFKNQVGRGALGGFPKADVVLAKLMNLLDRYDSFALFFKNRLTLSPVIQPPSPMVSLSESPNRPTTPVPVATTLERIMADTESISQAMALLNETHHQTAINPRNGRTLKYLVIQQNFLDVVDASVLLLRDYVTRIAMGDLVGNEMSIEKTLHELDRILSDLDRNIRSEVLARYNPQLFPENREDPTRDTIVRQVKRIRTTALRILGLIRVWRKEAS